jgi:predicted dehydrogenase
MLKVAMLSGWHVHADGYAREFAAIDGVKLTAMWDEQPQRGMDFARKYEMDYVPDLDVLLARDDVDAVCVTTPTNMHRDVIIKAAKAGKHIFTEKVLAFTVKKSEEIVKAVKEAGVKFCISYPHRTMPRNLFAKNVIDEGMLGDVTLLRVRNAHNGASAGWLPPHFYDGAQTGGGAMMDLGAHPMYLIRWFLGRPREVTSAFTDVTGHGVEDNAVSVFKYANGAIAISETGFVSEASPYILEVYGTKGSLLITGDNVRLHTRAVNTPYNGWITPDRLPAALPNAINQFVEAIQGNGEISFGTDDAVMLTEMMEMAYTSHKEGKCIKFNP